MIFSKDSDKDTHNNSASDFVKKLNRNIIFGDDIDDGFIRYGNNRLQTPEIQIDNKNP